MSNINIGFGQQEITINNQATLRFNPADPALYERFCQLLTMLETAGEEIAAAAKDSAESTEVDRWGVPAKGHKLAQRMVELDVQIKGQLSLVFGAQNNFDEIFEGVNVFAGTETGEWVITNFLNALKPCIEAGVTQRMQAKAAAAKQNRMQRRSAVKGGAGK